MTVATKPGKAKTVNPVTPGMDAGLKPSAPYSKSDIDLLLGLLKPSPVSSFTPQAAASVKAQTEPVVKQLTDSLTGEAKAGQAAIAGYSTAYLDRVKGLDDETKQVYDTAKQQQGSANAAIGKYLEGAGEGAGDEVLAQLRQINAGPAAEAMAAKDTTGTGKIAAGSTVATGTSVLDRLIEQGASAESSAKKLPAIGALQAQQTGREFGLQKTKELSDRLGEVTARVPAMVDAAVNDLVSADADRRANAANLVQQLIRDGHANEIQKALARQGYNTQLADTKNTAAQFNAGEINDLTKSLTGNTTTDSISATSSQDAVRQAATDAYAAATALIQPTPVVIGKRPNGDPIYRSKSGSRTFDPAQAQTEKKAPKFSDAYKQVFNRILPELTALDPVNARRIADQVTRAQLAAAGIEPKKG